LALEDEDRFLPQMLCAHAFGPQTSEPEENLAYL